MQFTDQLGNIISLADFPRRIVSLVPSQTELLFDLGLADRVVGITRFCIYPKEGVATKEKVGGTKNFDLAKIKALQPDLIIGNKEENEQDGILALQKEFPVWMSDITSLLDALDMIKRVGELTDTSFLANHLADDIAASFERLKSQKSTKKVAYFIWRKPYMVAATDTFINAMLLTAGFENVFENKVRYPTLTDVEMQGYAPDFVFLSSEPYAFSARHFEEFQSLFPSATIKVVDGELFSWYGSRLRYSAAYLEGLR